TRIAAFVRERYGAETPVLMEQPKQSSFGELAIPVAFQLARQLKQAPKAIASKLIADLGPVEGVSALEVAGNGYINVRFDRGEYGAAILRGADRAAPTAAQKIIVEHTNINPNKAAHIGHLRNAVLGDTFVRMLRATGQNVEVQNYIDNTGVQVADVVAGFKYLMNKSTDEVEAMIADPAVRFDYRCWDVYAAVSQNPKLPEWRNETLHEIEQHAGDPGYIGAVIANAIVRWHLRTMGRLGIVYDVLPRESEIIYLKFWETAFELLKSRKAIYFETEGKNKGCWVMPAAAFSDSGGEE